MGSRDPGQKLLSDVMRWKREAHELRGIVTRQAGVIEALQADSIALHVAGRLKRLDDFERFIGAVHVVDVDGNVDAGKLEAALQDLLRDRPELASDPHTWHAMS